jgi:hypothetical protein
MRDQRAVTHFHGAKDRYTVETALCERKTTVGVSVGAYGKAIRSLNGCHLNTSYSTFVMDITKIQLRVYSVQTEIFMT